MNQFSFEYPWLLATVLIFLLCAKFCKVKSRSIYFPHMKMLVGGRSRRSLWLSFFKWLTVLMITIAIASPILSKDYRNSKREGRDIVLIIDSSESMKQARFDASDMQKNKFTVVQEVASDFVASRQSDRIGLVTFADTAFVASPLTFETKFLQQIIGMQQMGRAGKRTAINDALVQTYNMLSDSTAKSKIAILLTDGIDNMSSISISEIKSLVQSSPVTLYTIGIGTNRDYDGTYLEELAKVGKGASFGASDAETLFDIYQQIDGMEASKIEATVYTKVSYLYFYPLFVSILSLLLFIYFRNIRGA